VRTLSNQPVGSIFEVVEYVKPTFLKKEVSIKRIADVSGSRVFETTAKVSSDLRVLSRFFKVDNYEYTQTQTVSTVATGSYATLFDWTFDQRLQMPVQCSFGYLRNGWNDTGNLYLYVENVFTKTHSIQCEVFSHGYSAANYPIHSGELYLISANNSAGSAVQVPTVNGFGVLKFVALLGIGIGQVCTFKMVGTI